MEFMRQQSSFIEEESEIEKLFKNLDYLGGILVVQGTNPQNSTFDRGKIKATCMRLQNLLGGLHPTEQRIHLDNLQKMPHALTLFRYFEESGAEGNLNVPEGFDQIVRTMRPDYYQANRWSPNQNVDRQDGGRETSLYPSSTRAPLPIGQHQRQSSTVDALRPEADGNTPWVVRRVPDDFHVEDSTTNALQREGLGVAQSSVTDANTGLVRSWGGPGGSYSVATNPQTSLSSDTAHMRTQSREGVSGHRAALSQQNLLAEESQLEWEGNGDTRPLESYPDETFAQSILGAGHRPKLDNDKRKAKRKEFPSSDSEGRVAAQASSFQDEGTHEAVNRRATAGIMGAQGRGTPISRPTEHRSESQRASSEEVLDYVPMLPPPGATSLDLTPHFTHPRQKQQPSAPETFSIDIVTPSVYRRTSGKRHRSPVSKRQATPRASRQATPETSRQVTKELVIAVDEVVSGGSCVYCRKTNKVCKVAYRIITEDPNSPAASTRWIIRETCEVCNVRKTKCSWAGNFNPCKCQNKDHKPASPLRCEVPAARDEVLQLEQMRSATAQDPFIHLSVIEEEQVQLASERVLRRSNGSKGRAKTAGVDDRSPSTSSSSPSFSQETAEATTTPPEVTTVLAIVRNESRESVGSEVSIGRKRGRSDLSPEDLPAVKRLSSSAASQERRASIFLDDYSSNTSHLALSEFAVSSRDHHASPNNFTVARLVELDQEGQMTGLGTSDLEGTLEPSVQTQAAPILEDASDKIHNSTSSAGDRSVTGPDCRPTQAAVSDDNTTNDQWSPSGPTDEGVINKLTQEIAALKEVVSEGFTVMSTHLATIASHVRPSASQAALDELVRRMHQTSTGITAPVGPVTTSNNGPRNFQAFSSAPDAHLPLPESKVPWVGLSVDDVGQGSPAGGSKAATPAYSIPATTQWSSQPCSTLSVEHPQGRSSNTPPSEPCSSSEYISDPSFHVAQSASDSACGYLQGHSSHLQQPAFGYPSNSLSRLPQQGPSSSHEYFPSQSSSRVRHSVYRTNEASNIVNDS